jgi:hypothetical protein
MNPTWLILARYGKLMNINKGLRRLATFSSAESGGGIGFRRDDEEEAFQAESDLAGNGISGRFYSGPLGQKLLSVPNLNTGDLLALTSEGRSIQIPVVVTCE